MDALVSHAFCLRKSRAFRRPPLIAALWRGLIGTEMQPTPELPPDVIDAIRANRKIDAIKRLRESTGLGLKEAKHAVETWSRANPQLIPPAPEPESSFGRIALVAAVLAVGYAAYRFLS